MKKILLLQILKFIYDEKILCLYYLLLYGIVYSREIIIQGMNPILTMKMIYVQGGIFEIGCIEDDCSDCDMDEMNIMEVLDK